MRSQVLTGVVQITNKSQVNAVHFRIISSVKVSFDFTIVLYFACRYLLNFITSIWVFFSDDNEAYYKALSWLIGKRKVLSEVGSVPFILHIPNSAFSPLLDHLISNWMELTQCTILATDRFEHLKYRLWSWHNERGMNRLAKNKYLGDWSNFKYIMNVEPTIK